jgi:hypothetical protein
MVHRGSVWIFSVSLCLCGSGFAASTDPGRLFYTPAQRAQLEAARTRGIHSPASSPQHSPAEAPQRYDGVIIRSDGQVTHWVDGKPATAAPRSLRPGQTRARGKVYESYQLLPPTSAQPASDEHPAP